MGRFIDKYHLKLQYHPSFAAAYQITEPASNDIVPPPMNESEAVDFITGPTTLPDSAASSRQSRLPPFDWTVQIEQLKTLNGHGDQLVRDGIYRSIQESLCSHYQEIIDRCHLGYTSKFKELIQDIKTMARLADKMRSPPSRDLNTKLMAGEPLSKLRECMSALCKAVGQNSSFIANELNKQDKLVTRARLFGVDSILAVTGSSLQSGIRKVIHHFEKE